MFPFLYVGPMVAALVHKTLMPKHKQQFVIGDRVRVAKDLGPSMSHFDSDCDAVVMEGKGTDYALFLLPELGRKHWAAWYHEHQLTFIRRATREELLEIANDFS